MFASDPIATQEPSRAEPQPIRWRRWAVILAAVACGSVLLVAAVLKLVGWNVSPFAQYGWLLSPTVQSFAVIWEVLLGVWLLSRKSPFLSWLATVLTFTTFAVVSGYLGIIGQANCGCFGVIKASPWAAFAVDVAALVLLALGRPLVANWAEVVGSLKWVGGVAALVVVVAAGGTLACGSLDAALASLRGQSLVVSPVVDFGSGKPGDVLSSQVTVRNYSGKTVRLVGGTSSCSCTATDEMPISIDPGDEVVVNVRLRIPSGQPGLMNQQIVLFSDDPRQPRIDLRVVCRIEP